MRKVLQGLGVLFLVVIVVFAGLWGYVTVIGNRLDRESRTYVDEAVPAITAHWSVEEARARSTPDLLRRTSLADFEKLMGLLAKLGPLVSYQGAAGRANFYYPLIGDGETVAASYLATAEFEHENATINFNLQKIEGVWRIQGFRVNSRVFEQIADH